MRKKTKMANICRSLRTKFFFSPVLKSPTHIGFTDVKKNGSKISHLGTFKLWMVVNVWYCKMSVSMKLCWNFQQSMGARNRVGIGLSYRLPWRNWFLGIDSWALKSLKIGALMRNVLLWNLGEKQNWTENRRRVVNVRLEKYAKSQKHLNIGKVRLTGP